MDFGEENNEQPSSFTIPSKKQEGRKRKKQEGRNRRKMSNNFKFGKMMIAYMQQNMHS